VNPLSQGGDTGSNPVGAARKIPVHAPDWAGFWLRLTALAHQIDHHPEPLRISNDI